MHIRVDIIITALFLFTFVGCTTPHTIQEAPYGSWKRHIIDNSSLGADGARSLDVNQDGLPDIVAGWEQGGVSRIYLMTRKLGSKPEWIQIDAGPAPNVEDALFADVDQDGAIDVISSTEGQNKKVLIHWAPSKKKDYRDSSKWETETLFEDGSQWMFATAMDIDGKHGPDIVIGGKGIGAKLGWLQSPSDPRKLSDWKFHFLTTVGWTMSILSQDMDDDGDSDILLSERKREHGGVQWLENPGYQSTILDHPWNNHWIANDMEEAMLIDTVDFDKDGIEEVIVPHYIDNKGYISIFKNEDGVGWQQYPLTYSPNMGRAKAVAAGDLNLDGKTDLVLSTEHADDDRSGIVWLEYQGSWDNPDWISHDVSGPEGIKFDLNLLLDIDGDTDLDIVNTEENNNARDGNAGLGLIWYENPTIGD